MRIVGAFIFLIPGAVAVAEDPTVRVEVTGVLVVTPAKEAGEKAAKQGPVFSIKGLDQAYAFMVKEELRDKAEKLAGKRVVLEGVSPILFAFPNVRTEPGLGMPAVVEPVVPVIILLSVTGVREAPPN